MGNIQMNDSRYGRNNPRNSPKNSLQNPIDAFRFSYQNLRQIGQQSKRLDLAYAFPAKYDLAMMHKRAYQFGYNPKQPRGSVANIEQGPPICACCSLSINTVQLPLCYGTTPSASKIKKGQKRFLLDSGASMFFTFIKMTIIYLLMRFIITDGFNLITNFLGSFCDNQQGCRNNFMVKASIFNKVTPQNDQHVMLVDILNLVTVLLSIVFFNIYNRYQASTYTLLDSTSRTQQDYTLFVENVPIYMAVSQDKGKNTFEYQKGLKRLFQQAIDEWLRMIRNMDPSQHNYLEQQMMKVIAQNPNFDSLPRVTSVSLCFDLTQIQNIQKAREQCMDKFVLNYGGGYQSQQSPYYGPNQVRQFNREYIELSKRFAIDNSASFNMSHFIGKAFVSFQFYHFKQYLLRQRAGKSSGILVQQAHQMLDLSPAAKPSQILWFNLKVTDKQRTTKVIYSYLTVIMMLGASFFLLVQLNNLEIKLTSKPVKEQDTQFVSVQKLLLSYAITAGMAGLTVFINTVLTWTIQYQTKGQYHKTQTDHMISLIIKLVLAQFFNMAVIYYIVSIVYADQIDKFSANGIVVKAMSLFTVSGAIQIALNALQIGPTITAILNSCKYKQQIESYPMFQIQLNKKLQDPVFSFAERYSEYIFMVLVVSFYAYITPMATPIVIGIFFVQYWIDKYNLFRRFSMPISFNYTLSRAVFKIFQTSLFAFALGNFLFAPQVHLPQYPRWGVVNYLTLIISVLYLIVVFILPTKWQQKIFFSPTYQTLPYDTCIQNKAFTKVYWMSNPGLNYAKQQDINRPGKFVQYADFERLAGAEDYNMFMTQLKQDRVYIDQYNEEDQNKVAKGLASVVEDPQKFNGMITQQY